MPQTRQLRQRTSGTLGRDILDCPKERDAYYERHWEQSGVEWDHEQAKTKLQNMQSELKVPIMSFLSPRSFVEVSFQSFRSYRHVHHLSKCRIKIWCWGRE